MNIICKPSFAFDAIAAIEGRVNRGRNDAPYVKIGGFFKEFDKTANITASDSNYNFLLEKYSFDEVEKMDLDTIAEVYPDCSSKADKIFNQKDTKGQFIKGFEILKNMEFADFWQENCLPLINNQCMEYDSILKGEVVDNILADIEGLKPNTKLEDITIYTTYFTCSVSFQLSPTTYLTSYIWDDTDEDEKINVKNVVRLFAHELIHGVSNEKSREIYIKAYQSDELLKKAHDVLFNKRGSTSNEEEFVVALDRYICFKNGILTKEEAYDGIFHYYGGCMPIAVIVFDELMKYEKLPEDINSWICDLFACEIIKVGEIESRVNSILPGYVDNLMNNYFKNEKH